MNLAQTKLLFVLGICVCWPGQRVLGQSFDERFEEIKQTATKEQLYALLFNVPKGGDLHNHGGLAYHAEMWFDAATNKELTHGNEFFTRTKFGNCPDSVEPFIRFRTIQRSSYQKLPACQKSEYEPLASLSAQSKADWLSAMKLDKEGEGRTEFFDYIGARLGELFRDPYIVTELLVENMKRYAAQGLRYLETGIGIPASFLDQQGNLIDSERGVQFYRDRLNRPDAKATGVVVRFQAGIVWSRPDAEQQLERVFEFVSKHRDLWVGVNMYDGGKGSAARFLETFRKMRRTYSGIGLSIHAGEVDYPGKEVRDTLLVGATRIGHGLNLISDPDTMLLMRNNKFMVEINLISNRLLAYTPDLTKHPFPEYLRFGIPVCLNTDDPGVWDSNMTDEYYTAVTTFNLTWEEIVELGRNSLVYSFVQRPVKERLLKEYDAAVVEFEKKYGEGDWKNQVSRVKPLFSGYALRTWGIRFPAN